MDGVQTYMKRFSIIPAYALLIIGTYIFSSFSVKAESFTPLQKRAIERIIHNYLLDKPELIVQAMEKLREREQAEQNNKTKELLRKYSNRIYHHPMSPYTGNKKGDVTLVEFFDYQLHNIRNGWGTTKNRFPSAQQESSDRGTRREMRK